MAIDRLSSLPEEIIHHVMSFLSTLQVTQTSILSKRFNSMWRTYPVIDFDQFSFLFILPSVDQREGKTEEFLNFVDNSLQHRRSHINLKIFRLRVVFCFVISDPRINRSIDFAIEKNVQELDINIQLQNGLNYYNLTDRVLAAQSIKVLKIQGCNLGVQDLILCCPLMEDFSLKECDGPKNIMVSTAKLLSLELDYCKELERIEVDAQNLQSFLFMPYRHSLVTQFCEINLHACEYLKTLKLGGPTITDKWFEYHIPKFTRLELFCLDGCETLRRIKISHQKLQRFELLQCCNVVEAEIDAPNLLSFTYCGWTPLSPLASTPLATLRCPNLLHAMVSWQPIVTTPSSAIASRNFLALFNQSKALTLVCSILKHQRFLEELEGSSLPPLYDLKHLKVQIGHVVACHRNWKIGCSVVRDRLPIRYEELVDSLLRLSPHLETLAIANGHLLMSIEFQYAERAMEDVADCSCRGWVRKCWRHALKNVTLRRFRNNDWETLFKFFIKNGKMLETITIDGKIFKVACSPSVSGSLCFNKKFLD